jgi:hypothetical protein
MAQVRRVERQPHSAGTIAHPPIVSPKQWLGARKKRSARLCDPTLVRGEDPKVSARTQ